VPLDREPEGRGVKGETEAGFLRAVIDLARLHGWLVYHPLPLRTAKGWATGTQGDAGFPDLTLAKGGRVILAELKTDAGKLTELQQRWVRASGAAVWRPAMWAEIAATLGE
jgi:hypothetical protein